MKIAVLGAGLTGLTSAFYLSKKGHDVTIFEKENFLGGLASGFKEKNWNWSLERTYHHLFNNDKDILDLAKETGFDKIIFRSPETASLYKTNSNYRIFPIDSPQDFFRLPLLNLVDKLRAASIIGFLKLTPFLSVFERQTSADFLKKWMGDKAWDILWKELFRKKFGKYAENILASFIWARIKKRTKNLGYPIGGFKSFIDHLETVNIDQGVKIHKGQEIKSIKNIQKDYDKIISTLSTPITAKIASDILPKNYLTRLHSIKYLHSVNLILETKKPFLEKTYWLSNCVKDLPFMVLVQHTNFMDKKHYNNHHIAYVANYVDDNDKLLKMKDEEVKDFYLNSLKKVIPNWKLEIGNWKLFRSIWAQPIFDRNFVKNKPDVITPVKNFYMANLDMTYPYDRGTNYAVKLGKKVSEIIGRCHPELVSGSV